MADMSKFTSVTMEAVCGIILIVAVAIPILGGLEVPSTMENADIITTLLSIVPVLLVVSIVVAIVYATVIKGRK